MTVWPDRNYQRHTMRAFLSESSDFLFFDRAATDLRRSAASPWCLRCPSHLFWWFRRPTSDDVVNFSWPRQCLHGNIKWTRTKDSKAGNKRQKRKAICSLRWLPDSRRLAIEELEESGIRFQVRVCKTLDHFDAWVMWDSYSPRVLPNCGHLTTYKVHLKGTLDIMSCQCRRHFDSWYLELARRIRYNIRICVVANYI